MAQCAQCKTQETQVYDNEVPICLACATDKAANINRSAGYGTMDGTGSNLQDDLKRSG